MTFSYRIKEEISKLECSKIEYISELSGILCTSSDLKLYSIKVQTENINAANRIFDIIHDNYSVTSNIAVKKNYNFKKNEMYVIETKKDVPEILKDKVAQDSKQIKKLKSSRKRIIGFSCVGGIVLFILGIILWHYTIFILEL